MVSLAEILFWLALFLPFYAYIGFPVLLLALHALFRHPVRKQPIQPSVSLLVPAYGEGEMVQRKIRNCLEIDYPRDRLQIVVACDGDKNDTPRLAREAAAGTPVQVVVHPVKSPVSKPPLLTMLLAASAGTAAAVAKSARRIFILRP